jgi:glycosyltransferase involved in cell wall biosynthesis
VARGLDAGVEFVGPTDHTELLGRIAEEVTVLVHPSRVETFSMILLEAMGVGVPVIGGRRSGAVPWLLAGGQAGVLVDIGSADQIASAMVRLARDTGLRARLAASGRKRVREHFDLDAVAAGYTQWFERAEA